MASEVKMQALHLFLSTQATLAKRQNGELRQLETAKTVTIIRNSSSWQQEEDTLAFTNMSVEEGKALAQDMTDDATDGLSEDEMDDAGEYEFTPSTREGRRLAAWHFHGRRG